MAVSSRSNSSLRIALVGCGEVCEFKHLPALQRVTGARVAALVDSNEKRLQHVGNRYGISARFADVRALLDARVADIVGVLTPPATHVSVALAALDAGCHVLIEKPLALDIGETDALVAAERRGPARVVMGLHMRWHRLVLEARERIRQGAIGALESIRGVWSSPRGDANIPAWKQRRDTGGGAIVELGVHVFDLWRFLSGADVVEVAAIAGAGVRDDERAAVIARLATGALASASLSERSAHDLEIHIAGDRGRLRLAGQRFDGLEQYAVHETDGMIGPRLRHLTQMIRELPRGLARMRTLGDYGDSYRGEWQHMVDVARDGIAPACTVEDGRASLRVVLAAAASAARGAPVRVDHAPSAIETATAHE